MNANPKDIESSMGKLEDYVEAIDRGDYKFATFVAEDVHSGECELCEMLSDSLAYQAASLASFRGHAVNKREVAAKECARWYRNVLSDALVESS